MTDMSKEAMKLALEALEGSTDKTISIRAMKALREALAEQPAQQQVAWVPYLSDRAAGVSGHYAIARWNPRGYREVWNLRRHAWGAYSDDVLSLEEADTLLRLIEIPTRKVETPQPAQPQQEPVAWMHWLHGPVRLFFNKDEAQMELERLNREYPVDVGSRKMRPLVFGDTSPPTLSLAQRKPLTVDEVWKNDELMSLNAELGCSMDLLMEVVEAIEAAHGITKE